MTLRRLLMLAGAAALAVAIVFALLREVDREEASLKRSISGIVETAPGAADLARTDRLALLLIDPESGRVMALKYASPFIPPLAMTIGEADAAPGAALNGSFFLLGISDKDGDVTHAQIGEAIGRSAAPIPIGTERVQLLLDRPFRGELPEDLASEIKHFQAGTYRRD